MIVSSFSFSSSTLSSRFTRTVFLIVFALFPNRKLDSVSSLSSCHANTRQDRTGQADERRSRIPEARYCELKRQRDVAPCAGGYTSQSRASANVPVTIRTVFVLPPMLSFNRCVRRESRYGMCDRVASVSAWMQLPRADRLWLMLLAS